MGALVLLGCPSDDTVSGATDSSSTTADDPTADPSTTPDPSTSSSAGMTTLPPESSSSSSEDGGSVSTSLDETTGTTTDETTGTTSDPTTGTGTDTEGSGSSSTTDTPGLDNGEQCMANDECASDMCFIAGILGGVCSECLSEDDCVWGCHLPNPQADPPIGAFCDDGTLGAGCDSNAGCMGGLDCVVVIDVPGILTASGCSECDADADCADQCAPVIDIAEIDGHWECVADGSRADGEFCDLAGAGEECSSGECATADIMGLVTFGICSECDNDNDCDIGESCEDATIDTDGTTTPATCV